MLPLKQTVKENPFRSNTDKVTAMKIAVVVSHPIQHFCPQYCSFVQNENIHLKVFFGSTLGYKKYVDENFKQEISWGNLHLEKFDHLFLNGEAVIPSDSKLDALTLEKELLAFAPDLLIQYGYFQKLQRRAYSWAIKNEVPIAYISDSELRHQSSHLKRLIKSWFLRRHFSRITCFLTVGNANETFYARHGVASGKMLRMHFPIDLKQYEDSYRQKDQLRRQMRERYAIAADEIVVAMVGKLSPWKSQDHLINALHLLEKQGVYVHLFILGSGETENALQLMAAGLQHSKVYFPGFVDIATLPAFYAASDIYAHPAALEPHSIAISEAIYMGCPVVLSNRCGSFGETDDVQNGKNGFVFEYGNIYDLANKLKLLATDGELRAQFGLFSHQIAMGFQANAHFNIIEKITSYINDKKIA